MTGRREFIIHTQAWWASANPLTPPSVYERIIVEDDDAEFAFEFHNFSLGMMHGNPLHESLTTKLVAFDDAWAFLAQLEVEHQFVTTVLREKATGITSTPEGISITLTNMGFVDATPRTREV